MRVALLLLAGMQLAMPAAAACWLLQAEQGSIRFVARQAGADVAGRFASFAGRYCSEAPGAEGRVEIRVDTASVRTALPELDELLRGPLFLDAERWPQARLDGRSSAGSEAGQHHFEGRLRIRDRERPISLRFELEQDGSDLLLRASTELQRLSFDLGLGEWRDTQWVDDRVTLAVEARLPPEAATSHSHEQ